MDLQQAFETLVRILNDLTFLPLAAGFVLIVVALLKRVIPERFISPQGLALMVQVIVWIIYLIAKERLGVDEAAFQSYLEILTAVGSALLMIVSSALATQKAYTVLERNKVPVLGAPQPLKLRKAAA